MEANERHIMRPAGTITLTGPVQAQETPSITHHTQNTFFSTCVIIVQIAVVKLINLAHFNKAHQGLHWGLGGQGSFIDGANSI